MTINDNDYIKAMRNVNYNATPPARKNGLHGHTVYSTMPPEVVKTSLFTQDLAYRSDFTNPDHQFRQVVLEEHANGLALRLTTTRGVNFRVILTHDEASSLGIALVAESDSGPELDEVLKVNEHLAELDAIDAMI